MQKEKYSIGELTVDNIIGGGINPLVHNIVYLDPAAGSDGQDGKTMERAVKTLAQARLKVTTGKNDVIVLVQSTSFLNLAADPDFTENYLTIAGNAVGHMFSQRSRIAMASDYGTPMITVEGYGNRFQNLYVTQGYSTTAVAKVGWLIQGNYNSFDHVHFSAPISSGLGADAAFRALRITAVGETCFNHCTFGMDSMDMTTSNALISLGNGSITVFEDCIFYCRIAATTPYFFEVTNTGTSQLTRAFFKGCQFLAFPNGAYTMAEAFLFTGANPAFMYLDPSCRFDNVTLLSASGTKTHVRVPTTGYAAADADHALIGTAS